MQSWSGETALNLACIQVIYMQRISLPQGRGKNPISTGDGTILKLEYYLFNLFFVYYPYCDWDYAY